MSSIFQNNPQNYRVTTQGIIPPEVIAHYDRYGLHDRDFTDASQHPEVRAEQQRLEDARINLGEQQQPLPDGWLDGVNEIERSLTNPEQADEWVSHADAHEPSAAERAAGEVVSDRQITEYIVAVRRSNYTKELLAGMKPEDFDLAA